MEKAQMAKRNILVLVALMAGLSAAHADTLKMDGMQAGGVERPKRGMTQNSVEAKYGSPVDKIAAVGEPPISRWEYPEFVVYFEYDRVIHAVIKR